MELSLSSPALLVGLVAGIAGVLMIVQGRTQARMLRARIVSGVGTVVIDPVTGLFSAAAAWQCIRAEANRAARLERPLDVWVGTARDAEQLDIDGRALAFDMPAGARGIRVDRVRVCVLSCASDDGTLDALGSSLEWRTERIAPGETTAQDVLAFLSEVPGA